MKRRLVCALLLFIAGFTFVFANGQSEDKKNDSYVTVEDWGTDNRKGVFDENHPWGQFFIDELGVKWWGPQVPWNGGSDYIQQLRLRAAAGELPDTFGPYGGIEYELINQGALADLSEYLPKHAPVIWNNIPQDIWDIVRKQSPDGKSIYFIPQTWTTPIFCAFIRQDWLDRLGLEVPTTIQELETVLRAFRDQDANGNGDPNDEYPTGGRQDGRWMDYLYAAFGVSNFEGYPHWHEYNGELTYSAVTQNMRDCLEWIAKLYAEGLLDPETFLNSKAMWDGKIANNQVGVYYHLPKYLYNNSLLDTYNMDKNVKLTYLPALKGSGYEPSYFYKSYLGANKLFANNSPEKIAAGLKVLNWLVDPEMDEVRRRGVENFDYIIDENGKEVRIANPPDLRSKPQAVFFESIISIEKHLTHSYIADELKPLAENAWEIAQALDEEGGTVLDGQLLTEAIYDGYPDIKNRTLYLEYISNIILGIWPIEKFDEFVEKWYASGGDVVTERARAEYAVYK